MWVSIDLYVRSDEMQEILCLTFHLAAPHILASASSDKTVRIWNILGGEVTPPEPGDKLSENYPMAMADEGNVIVAVLAGEGSGGHRSKVVGVVSPACMYDLIR